MLFEGREMINFDKYLEDLKSLIACKSVISKPSEKAPFGSEIRKALDLVLDLAKEFGFETKDYDGYGGEIILASNKKCETSSASNCDKLCDNNKINEVGIVGHLDVVPVGIGWDTDPFTLTEKDGILYGRGVSDDKTPILSCLYILKELKDSGKPINKTFRLILGCDEETGWRDIAYMKEKTTFPEFGFSPDGNFPLTYAEKGIVEVKCTLPPLKNFNSLKGGTVVNAVCAYASVVPNTPLDNDQIKGLEKFGLKYNDGKIESFGKAAHGSTPHLGKNAIKPLVEYLIDRGENLQRAIDCLFTDQYGVQQLTTEQGNLTLSPDLIDQDDQGVYITCDCRIPAPLSIDDVNPYFEKFDLAVKTKVRHNPAMVSKDGPFVQTLLNAYNTITGENAQPKSSGGVTFSRVFKRGCAFGPKFPNHNDQIHDANENLPIKNLLTAYEIYKKAIFDLNEIKL